MQDIIDKIRVASARSLIRLVGNALEVSRAEIEALGGRHGDSEVLPLADQSPATLQLFKQHLYANFARLGRAQQAAQRGELVASDEDKNFDGESGGISLLDHDYIEAMIAMDSMIRAMRERPIPGMPQLLARLKALYPDVTIDASNNPLDPEQIGECFNLAIRPLGLKAHVLLTIYREFNDIVFANLGNVIEEVNRLLAVSEELPEMAPAERSDTETPDQEDSAPTITTTSNPVDEEQFVSERIQERVFDENLDPAIRNLLDSHLRNALLKILRSEGTQGKSWTAVMQTIDAMLWSVQTSKQNGDREKFQSIRERLLSNVEKALEFSEASKTKTRRALRQLAQIQDYSFLKAETQRRKPVQIVLMSELEPPALPFDDPQRIYSRKLPVGTWIEFEGVDGQPVRVSLTVKIDSIEKLIFTDGRGDKVLELSCDRLANALKRDRVRVLREKDGSA